MEDFIFSTTTSGTSSSAQQPEKWKEEIFFKTEDGVDPKAEKNLTKDFSFSFPEIAIPETAVFELSQEFLANISKIDESSLFGAKPFEISFAPEDGNNSFLQTQPAHLTMELPIHSAPLEQALDAIPSRLKVFVYHRPRKSLGLWQQVNESDAIRVTKGKGKWILVRVAVNTFLPESILFLPKISLIDLASNNEIFPCAGIMGADQSRLSNVATKVGESITGTVQEFKFKLDKTGSTLQFQAIFEYKGKRIAGKSVVFSSQDSGKRRSSLKLKQLFGKKQNHSRSPRNSGKDSDFFFAAKRTSSPRESFNKEVLKKKRKWK